ncbi:MAG: hypothetical protein AB1742_04600 [bacterium]
MSLERKIEYVIETVRNARGSNANTMLLIGAGCSRTAGIPLADEIVGEIHFYYPSAYERAVKNTYPECMKQLAPDERRDLINGHIQKARLNWEHVVIAELMEAGYVDRVLTTNFDPLLIRACALIGVLPAIYDFATATTYRQGIIPSPAVLYLQGQYTGFFQRHTPDDAGSNSVIPDILNNEGSNRAWIVVGYSGENDPLIEHLAKISTFNRNLYWICYRDDEPGEKANNKVISEGKYAFKVKGYDAHDFFVTLAQKLGCFPPKFISMPFTYLLERLDILTEFRPPAAESPSFDVLKKSREDIESAISLYEKGTREEDKGIIISEASSAFMAGKYERVINLISDKMAEENDDMADKKTWSLIIIGNNYLAQAKTKTGEDADRLFSLSYEKYEQAMKIKPDMHEALNNWSNAFIYQSYGKTDREKDMCLMKAEEKCLEAEKIVRGFGAYNLACINALRGCDEECRKWLEISNEKGFLPGKDHIEKDTDLNSMKDKAWFKEFMNNL